ncbi:MAG: hypothetical protein U1F17_02195, partial [Burkholderiaceae bacterium]
MAERLLGERDVLAQLPRRNDLGRIVVAVGAAGAVARSTRVPVRRGPMFLRARPRIASELGCGESGVRSSGPVPRFHAPAIRNFTISACRAWPAADALCSP